MSSTSPSPPPQRTSARPMIIVCLATAMLMLDIAVVNTAASSIARDLHSGLGGLQWVVDAYTLALATIVLSCGSLADRIGRRRVFAGGMALFTAASLGCGLAATITVLDIARVIQGAGAAAMFATSLAILSVTYRTPQERGTAFAALGASIGASFALGPLVGGALTSTFGWQASFIVNVPLGIVGLLAIRAWLPESRNPRPASLDWPGQIALTAGMFLLVLGLLRGNADGWGSAAIIAELAGGAGALIAFVLIQIRSQAPMMPLSLFASRSFSATQVTVFAISVSFFAIYLYLTLYLQEVLHLSPIQTGLVYLPCTIVLFLVSGASAALGRRVAPGLLVAGGLAIASVGMVLLTLAGTGSSWSATLPGSLVVGIGTGLFNPAASELALSSVPERHSGLASGINDTFRQAGIPLGVAIYGTLMPASAAVGHGSPAAFVSGLHHALWLAAGVGLIGAVIGARLLGLGLRRRAATPIAVVVESA